jgi:hypothetical protein
MAQGLNAAANILNLAKTAPIQVLSACKGKVNG